jgi:hypothetical protein
MSSGLELGDDFAKLLTKITGLTQVDLIGAELTNQGLLSLLGMSLVGINVSNNLGINQEIIAEIARMEKKFNNLVLVLTGTLVNITYALVEQVQNKGINLFLL